MFDEGILSKYCQVPCQAQNADRVMMNVFTVRESGLNCWLEASISTLSQLVFSVSVCIDTTVTRHSQYIDTVTETRAGF